VHTLPEAEQRAVFERFCVPTPGRIYTGGLAAPFTDLFAAEPARRKVPLLMVAAELDRTVPAAMVQDGCEEVCDAALAWAESARG
jgi:hypothetical protein